MTVDNCGRQVTFDKPPERVLAIGPEAASLLAEAGAADKITSYSGPLKVPFGKAEQAVRSADHIGPANDYPKLEEIIAARPDVVIGWDAGVTEQLDATGIKTLFTSGYCGGDVAPRGDFFSVIYDDIETYGKLFGTQDAAAKSVTELRNRVAAVEKQVADAPLGSTAAALYLYTDQPFGAYGRRSVQHEQIRILGLRNVFGDVDKRYFELSVEEIINRNPQFIIALNTPEDTGFESPQDVIQYLRSRKELANIKAIQDDAILVINAYYTSPGPVAVEGLEQLAKQITAR